MLPPRCALAAAFLVLAVAGCGSEKGAGDWPLANADREGTRAATGSSIDAGNVGSLAVRWRFRLPGKPTVTGAFASNPVVEGGIVYAQDLNSNVYALDLESGSTRWARRYNAPNEGPNGLAVDGGTVYGATDAEAFALSADTGKELWRRHLTSKSEQFVDVAPIPWEGLVFLGTVGYAPLGRGAIYALDADTGAVVWKFDTIEKPWPHPLQSGGGGIWYPVSVDSKGRLYAGIANPTPWGGSPEFPNGSAFPGPVRYTDSLVVLDATTGRLLWFDQVTPHDVRDQDFQATPILTGDLAIGAGKGGRVIAWDREERARRWTATVGRHRNDVGPLPRRRVVVCPGLLGGVETPMAYADGRVFVPVVDLCGWGSGIDRQEYADVDPSKGRGRLVALEVDTGRELWERGLGSPAFGCATVSNDVVFTSTYDGTVYAFGADDGKELWRARMRAGVNACPAVAGDVVVVGAGIPRAGGGSPELVAYGPVDG
ncbi:MAG TPA: PQQ-binding-like beta-propeller repeat protein [Gaiella sp.]|nr:PQQ-binding-like beta-propeller repeat protein [Gaiella sp.]